MTCYNRDERGRCLAFSGVKCSEDCSARITDPLVKVRMLQCLLEKANAKKLRRNLQVELNMAIQTMIAIREKRFASWMAVYVEDLHRGSGGGQSESDSNRKTGLKQLMKDNRPVGVKPTKAQLEEYKEALADWEEAHGRLERLGRGQLSGDRIDSYIGLPVCIEDKEEETCSGETTSSGRLRAVCQECPWRV